MKRYLITLLFLAETFRGLTIEALFNLARLLPLFVALLHQFSKTWNHAKTRFVESLGEKSSTEVFDIIFVSSKNIIHSSAAVYFRRVIEFFLSFLFFFHRGKEHRSEIFQPDFVSFVGKNKVRFRSYFNFVALITSQCTYFLART